MRSATPLLVLLAVALASGCQERPPRTASDFHVDTLLGGESSHEFAFATAPAALHFPQDHGPHPRYQTEWWYFTGNLHDPDGRHFGFQLAFFRFAFGVDEPRAGSAWRPSQMYMAHLALTDTQARRFHAFERMSRGTLGLAGASSDGVWLDDWRAGNPGELPPVHLQAAQGDVALDLELGAGKPMVLQGDRGRSRKGPEPGNASYYYALTRLPASGEVRLGEARFQVTGSAWMDREWSTSALGPHLDGWDWFAVQLADGFCRFFSMAQKIKCTQTAA